MKKNGGYMPNKINETDPDRLVPPPSGTGVRTYAIKPSAAKAAAEQQRAQTAKSLSLGQWAGGPITSAAQLAGALVAKGEAEKLIKRFTSAAKAWVDEHGPVTGADGRTWGPIDVVRTEGCKMSVDELVSLVIDCGASSKTAKAFCAELRARGIGREIISRQFRWAK